MDEITLSNTEFKALASETRTDIIKLLNSRNHTLSEISKKVELAAPTVKQHLGLLEQAGLIKCIDEGRKWKYYCLTKKGKRVMEPEPQGNVLIVLGLSIIGMAVVVLALLSRLAGSVAQAPLPTPLVNKAVEDSLIKASGEMPLAGASIEQETVAEAANAAAGTIEAAPSWDVLLLAMAGIIFAAIIVLLLLKIRRK